MKMQEIKNKEDLEQYKNFVLDEMKNDNPIAIQFSEKYQKIVEKLPDDLKWLAPQYLLLFGMMFEEADDDPFFADQLLLGWKTWDRLSQYLANKARSTSDKDKSFRLQDAMVDSFTLLEWVKEYYALDDKEEYEKELAEKAEAEKKRLEREAKMAELKKKSAEKNAAKKKTSSEQSENPDDEDSDDSDESEDDENEDSVSTTITTIAKKKSSKEIDGQTDFFSLLAD